MITLGCIADDFTGGTDVAAGAAPRRAVGRAAVRRPRRRRRRPGRRRRGRSLSRPAPSPAAEAVAESLAALGVAAGHGRSSSVYFKYCSTFDSTDDGNIGPVTDALLEALGETMTLICPASPEHGRTVVPRPPFVGDELLSESSMRHHPLTPMTDPNIVRVLRRQTAGPVGLLPLPVVQAGTGRGVPALKDLATQRRAPRRRRRDRRRRPATVAAGLATLRRAHRRRRARRRARRVAGRRRRRPRPVCRPSRAADRARRRPRRLLLGRHARPGRSSRAPSFPSLPARPRGDPRPGDHARRGAAWLRENCGQRPGADLLLGRPRAAGTARAAMGPDTADILERTLGALARDSGQRSGRGGSSSPAGRPRAPSSRRSACSTVVVDSEEDRGVPVVPDHRRRRPLALLLKSGNFGAGPPRPRHGQERTSDRPTTPIPTAPADRRRWARPCSPGRSPSAAPATSQRPHRRRPSWSRPPASASVPSTPTHCPSSTSPAGTSTGAKPSKEAFLHAAVYRARPDAGAVVHLHSTHSVAVSCLADLDPARRPAAADRLLRDARRTPAAAARTTRPATTRSNRSPSRSPREPPRVPAGQPRPGGGRRRPGRGRRRRRGARGDRPALPAAPRTRPPAP